MKPLRIENQRSSDARYPFVGNYEMRADDVEREVWSSSGTSCIWIRTTTGAMSPAAAWKEIRTGFTWRGRTSRRNRLLLGGCPLERPQGGASPGASSRADPFPAEWRNGLRSLPEGVAALRHYPAIVNCNIGTSMKGAVDQVEKIVAILSELGIDRYHLHCDAALLGSALPFREDSPIFDFRQAIASMAISGHLAHPFPIPCGWCWRAGISSKRSGDRSSTLEVSAMSSKRF